MSDRGFADEIVPSGAPRHALPAEQPRRDFRPWHRVRKQYIRERQWNYSVKRLVQRHLRQALRARTAAPRSLPIAAPAAAQGAPGPPTTPAAAAFDRPLRCLFIPGDEMLDVRSLWQELRGEEISLSFLGFNSAATGGEHRLRTMVSQNAITQLPMVVADSQVVADEFEKIACRSTQAHRYLEQYGPYDVVNLDFCGSLLPRGGGAAEQRRYDAIMALLAHQTHSQTSPWLLFVTSQVTSGEVNANAFSKLAGPTRKNFDQHSAFAEKLRQLVQPRALEGAAPVDHTALSAEELARLFGVLLGKWIMQSVAQAQPPSALEMLSSYYYSASGGPGVRIASVAYLVSPRFRSPRDATGLSTFDDWTPPQPDLEAAQAVRLADAAAASKDVDRILSEDRALAGQLTERAASLMTAAGFDAERYLAWVGNGEPLTAAGTSDAGGAAARG